ncbi:MAG: right-handed parallel beta-helix repeat-containing protein [Pseudomonadota bacterium]
MNLHDYPILLSCIILPSLFFSSCGVSIDSSAAKKFQNISSNVTLAEAPVATPLHTATKSLSERASAESASEPLLHSEWQDVSPGLKPDAPLILYTDVLSGPNSGGENNFGMYLTIFGKNFGVQGLGAGTKVYVNGVEVARYVGEIGHARGRSDIQSIAVQVGALGRPSPGKKLPIKVVVNNVASNEDHTFAVQPGNIFYLDNVTGDDATGVAGNIHKPFRYVQKGGCGVMTGVLTPNKIRPGDVLVLRAKKDKQGNDVMWSDLGCNRRFARFRNMTGTAPTGKSGSGPITLMGYPGENVHLKPPVVTPKMIDGHNLIDESERVAGGIHGMNGQKDYSDWITIANLRIEGGDWTASEGPLNLQTDSNHWRIVNNELYQWLAADRTIYYSVNSAGVQTQLEAKSGAISGNGKDVGIFGNHIHHIYGTQHNHCIYLDSYSEDIEIAFNHIHDCMGGNIIQTYDNVGMSDGSSRLTNITVHHNLMHDGHRYGLNIADNTRSLAAWDNIIYNTDMAGVRFNVNDAQGEYSVVFNTLYNVKTIHSGSYQDAIEDSWGLAKSKLIEIKHNIVVPGGAASEYIALNRDGIAGSWPPASVKIEHNLWYGLAHARPANDIAPILGDPQFVAANKADFHLNPSSAAVGKAQAPVSFRVESDYDMRPRGARKAVGAFEAP